MGQGGGRAVQDWSGGGPFPLEDENRVAEVGETAISSALPDRRPAVAKRAVAEGAVLTQPVADRFYGDRNGLMTDPFGHKWRISTRLENVPPEEMKKRAALLGTSGYLS